MMRQRTSSLELVNNFHIFSCGPSDSNSLNDRTFSDTSALLTFAACLIITEASSSLPLDASHLADSGNKLKFNNDKNI